MSYDEELTPEIDPPIVEPPPQASLLGRIFAHRRPAQTVVEAPLHRVADAPPVTEPGDGEPAAESRTPEQGPESRSREPGEPPAAAATEGAAPGDEPARGTPVPGPPQRPPATEPTGGEPPVGEPTSGEPTTGEPQSAPAVATRYCPACGDRVAVAADGLRCAAGHRLSPAHARRRWWAFWRGR